MYCIVLYCTVLDHTDKLIALSMEMKDEQVLVRFCSDETVCIIQIALYYWGLDKLIT